LGYNPTLFVASMAIRWVTTLTQRADLFHSQHLKRLQKSGMLLSRNVPKRRTVGSQRAKWPHHTDTRVLLLTAFGRERVGVVMQQFVGGFQANAVHRVERQRARMFTVRLGLLDLVMGTKHRFDHRQGKLGAGALVFDIERPF
jgi:hypothetical protein